MNSRELKKKILEWGASLVGFADLEGLAPEKCSLLETGVSIAVQLSNAIIDEIRDGPTLTYAYHYRTTNQLLDSIATKASNFIQSLGYQALPVPASQRVNSSELRGLISHKMVATRAGLGWIGKSALLITAKYGPRMRLVSVLTDAPIRTSKPISKSRCGECMLCVEVCPAKALKGRNWTLDTKREDLMETSLCHEVTSRNKEIFGERICGMCISVCPFGRTKKSKS
jgi:epoxyqueuosine reductase